MSLEFLLALAGRDTAEVAARLGLESLLRLHGRPGTKTQTARDRFMIDRTP